MEKKFEFVNHVVTRDSFDKMVKTWLRKDSEKMKRNHASQIKALERYNTKQWENIKKYWNSPSSKHKSEQMCESRKKVNYNPHVGRDGYASKEERLVCSSLFLLFHRN